jgi:hypothetical protein
MSRHESVQTSMWWLITRKFEEFLKEGKQMNTTVCAPEDVDKVNIKKLQTSIVKVCRRSNQLHNRLIRGNEEVLGCLSCMTGNCHVQFLGVAPCKAGEIQAV